MFPPLSWVNVVISSVLLKSPCNCSYSGNIKFLRSGVSILATIESAARWTGIPIVSRITSAQHLSLIGDKAIHGFG